MLKEVGIVLALTGASCTPTLTAVLQRRSPAEPVAPESVDDTLLAIVLGRVLREGGVDFPAGAQLVVISTDSSPLTARGLPRGMASFHLMSYDDIQTLADRVGSLRYLHLTRPRIAGDSAEIWVHTSFAFRRTGRPIILLAGGGCAYPLRRAGTSWESLKPQMCLIS